MTLRFSASRNKLDAINNNEIIKAQNQLYNEIILRSLLLLSLHSSEMLSFLGLFRTNKFRSLFLTTPEKVSVSSNFQHLFYLCQHFLYTVIDGCFPCSISNFFNLAIQLRVERTLPYNSLFLHSSLLGEFAYGKY